jgi:hypothetical protein
MLFASCIAVFAERVQAEPAFEVASIQASDSNLSNPRFIAMSAGGAFVRYTNIRLCDRITASAAYRISR